MTKRRSAPPGVAPSRGLTSVAAGFAHLAHDLQALRLANYVARAREMSERFRQQSLGGIRLAQRHERRRLILHGSQQHVE